MAYEDVFRSIKVKSGKIGLLKTQFMSVLQGTTAEFGFPYNVETSTVQAVGYAKVYDLSAAAYLPLATSSSGGGYTANFQCFPDTEAIGDFVIFGAAAPFGIIRMQSSQGATYSGDGCLWYYWNGTAWSALTILFDTTNTTPAADGKRPFMQAGDVIFSAPTDWAASTIDSQEAYWVKCNINAATMTQEPLVINEHGIISCALATEAPADGTIGRGRTTFITTSGTTDNTDVILCNLTSGASSVIKVWAKNTPQGIEVADYALPVTTGDALAFYVTDEDGTTEYANGIVEFDLERT